MWWRHEGVDMNAAVIVMLCIGEQSSSLIVSRKEGHYAPSLISIYLVEGGTLALLFAIYQS